MKLVPFANRVRMDVKAFTSRPSVPLLITNSIFLLLWTPCLVMFTSVAVHPSILFLIAIDYVIRKFSFTRSRWHSNCVSYGSDVFPCHASRERKVLARSIKLVPFANRVRMDVKAFTSRPSVPLLITNSILEDASVTWIELDNIYSDG
ncbi:hypothetical protein T07_6397 [Trichinella nelsoni]|uniref:Uncharacterized protein n=1 Tax=Trichinella nelsoni TaxID=6336 RepID=A0A0V0REC8_9BILA|nr:hypothetical protein T07_6397 [Trichinella nelsoni]